MRKIIYILAVFILSVFSNEISAQLYVKTGSFIFNKASSVYVKGDIELDGTSKFYLRNEGQLLQGGTVSNGSNKGTGELSVFQEGTVNNFAYNYWCSPIGNVTASSTGNRDFGITLLNRPTTLINSIPATPTAATYNGSTNDAPGALNIASYWIFKYPNPSISYTDWIQSAALTDIAAGQGFSMKGSSGTDGTDVGEIALNNPGSNQRYDFRGKPNDGNISINVGADLYTLTGNPYPSAIDLCLFLGDGSGLDGILGNADDVVGNPDLDGVAYFWEQDKTINSHNLDQYYGGYSAFNGRTQVGTGALFTNYDLAGNPIVNPTPPFFIPYYRRFCPIGQGFMVKGKTGASGSPAVMRNIYRVFTKEGDGLTDSSLTHFEKNDNPTTSTDYGFYNDMLNVAGTDYTQISRAPTPHIKINSTLNSNTIRQLALCFMDTAIDGVDRADTKNPDQTNNLPYDVYFYLGNTEFIHSTTSFDINKRFPIGFKNNGQAVATYRIQVAEFVNFDAAENVYLYDSLTNAYYNIKNNYYELTLAPGVYDNRFEITFLTTALGIDDNLNSNFVIVQNNSNQLLSIANPNLLDVKSVTLYDILGKRIFDKVNLGSNSSYEFSTSSLSEGVYVVKLITADDKSLGQKIIVRRSN